MLTTPGIYFEQVDRGRPATGLLRTDIAAFVGYAERGPLFQPVKINSWRQFLGFFGTPLAVAYLPLAVQGFFANGGAACYVVRIADNTSAAGAGAREAAATVNNGHGQPRLRFFASHGPLYDPATQAPLTELGRPLRFTSPGAWGNRLAISLYSGGLGRALTIPGSGEMTDGLITSVTNLSGFEVGSVVQMSQEGSTPLSHRLVKEIDASRKRIRWDQPLLGMGIDPTRPVRLESVEFSVQLLLDGQIVERHANLSLSPDHSRFVVAFLQANSNWIDVQLLENEAPTPACDLFDPLCWPVAVDALSLSGGRDGLSTVTKAHFLEGVGKLESVDEVSIVAAPDAVWHLPPPTTPVTAGAQPASCDELNPPDGRLEGVVLDAGSEVESPLAGVTVVAPGTLAASQITGTDGTFVLETLPVGLVTLRLQKAGYGTVETSGEARRNPTTQARFHMSPLTTPPTLNADEIAEIHEALLQQGAKGLYRVALLDPPVSALGFDEIQSWRARFDSTYGALYYPWLKVDAIDHAAGAGQLRDLPPSGHVAGLIARTDLTEGVHRAPANSVLDGVKALTDLVDDGQQGILNPLGINCIRILPGRGIRVYGARTVSSDPEWRYLNVRRLLLMIEESVEDSNQWAVFEPNNGVLRQTLTHSLNSFLNLLWRQGVLAGDAPIEAYQVKCNDENNPPSLVDVGQMVAEIAVAPSVPFEFIRFRLGRTIEAVEVTE